jgi:hypothetical protein
MIITKDEYLTLMERVEALEARADSIIDDQRPQGPRVCFFKRLTPHFIVYTYSDDFSEQQEGYLPASLLWDYKEKEK